MSSRPAAADRSPQEPAHGGMFVTHESVKYLLLTSFKPDGAPVTTAVRVVTGKGRAYFRALAVSGTARRLRHSDWVQVAPCSVLGFSRYGPTAGATARLLAGEEASQAAGQLDRVHPAWRGAARSVLHRLTGWQTLHYELRGDADQDEPTAPGGTGQAKRVRVRLIPAADGRRAGP